MEQITHFKTGKEYKYYLPKDIQETIRKKTKHMSEDPKVVFHRNYKILKKGITHTLIRRHKIPEYKLIPNNKFIEDNWEIGYMCENGQYSVDLDEAVLKFFAEI